MIKKLDHLAFRCTDRHETAKFFCNAMGYKIAEDLPDGFEIKFDDGSTAKCLVLVPPTDGMPEVFVSDGEKGSIVGEWAASRGGAGLHHAAFRVDSVSETMKEWKEKGYAEFTSEEPMKCPGLTQVFTTPSSLTGIIFEFIEREKQGFCKDNVKDLMESTKKFK